MKACSKCNIEYDDNKKFCKKCGSSLEDKQKLDPKQQAKKTVFEERIKAEPLNVTLLKEYLEFLCDQSLFDDAVLVALKILAIDENDVGAKEHLLNAYVGLESYNDAIETGEELYSAKSDDPVFLENLAYAYQKTGSLAKAISIYDDILGNQPDNVNVLHKKAFALLADNKMAEAAKIFGLLREKGLKDTTTIVYSGIHKAITESYQEAINTLQDVVSGQDLPKNSIEKNRALLYFAGSLAFNEEPIKEVIRWFDEIYLKVLREHYQELDEHWYATICLYILSDELEHFSPRTEYADLEAFQDMIETFIREPGSYFTDYTKYIRAEMWYFIGLKQLELGYLKKSLRALDKAAELNPDNTQYLKKLKEAKELSEARDRRKRKHTLIFWIVLIVALGGFLIGLL